MDKSEIWKDIPGLEGCYQASSLGAIRSVDRVSTLTNHLGTFKRPIKGKIIKANVHQKTGYKLLSLCVDGVITTALVHRLVALAFHENKEGKPQVNHKNGIKTDNRSLNLEWSTISENRKHSFDIGLATARGEKNSQVKLTSVQVLEIRNSDKRNGELAKAYGISPATVCDIQKKRSWSHI